MDPEAYLKWVNSWRQIPFIPTMDVGYGIWKRLVHLYSQTRVTKASDKLIAISGLAKRMRAIMQNEEKFLAGLWSLHLTSQVLWKVAPNAIGSRIPRWRRPYREAIDGHIRLRGSLIRAELMSSNEEGSRSKMDLWVNGMNTDSAVSLDEVRLDESYSLVYLPMAGEYDADGDGQAVIGIRALLLVPVKGKPQGWYSRFGFANTWHDREDPEPMNHLIRVMEDRTFNDETLSLEGVPRTIMFL
ncbi:hypothetical protein V2G26_018770 [Clonostachys chloroleuca]